MRMSPPIGLCPWRQVGEGGEIVDGHFILKGYCVGTGIYSIHHNASYFPSPHEFIPERWLPDSKGENEQLAAAKSAFNPFSLGSRSCIGKSLAYSELLLTMAVLIWKYDFQVAPGPSGKLGAGCQDDGGEAVGRGNPAEFQLVDRIIGLKDGPMLQFRPRQLA